MKRLSADNLVANRTVGSSFLNGSPAIRIIVQCPEIGSDFGDDLLQIVEKAPTYSLTETLRSEYWHCTFRTVPR